MLPLILHPSYPPPPHANVYSIFPHISIPTAAMPYGSNFFLLVLILSYSLAIAVLCIVLSKSVQALDAVDIPFVFSRHANEKHVLFQQWPSSCPGRRMGVPLQLLDILGKVPRNPRNIVRAADLSLKQMSHFLLYFGNGHR